ncbi:MAG: CapA family protein [Bacteroidales bacterium]|nr:CapA family protein [Bacteroidales bacterium]
MTQRILLLLLLAILSGGCTLFRPINQEGNIDNADNGETITLSRQPGVYGVINDTTGLQREIGAAQDTISLQRQIDDVTQETVSKPGEVLIFNSDSLLCEADTAAVAVEEISVVPAVYTFALTGDIMPGTSFPDNRYLPPGDDPWPLISEVAPFISEAFIAAGNLEGPLTDKGELAKKCRDTTSCYAFRIPERYGSMLTDAGFDILSLANNHIGDFGLEGRNRTAWLLDSLGIASAGLETSPFTIVQKDSLTIGFAAFSPNKGTPYINDYKYMQELVRFLDDTCDIVMVSFHGGAEGREYENVTGAKEYFYGEDRGNVVEFARLAVDSGADIVFGHGPHVTRAMEVYKERFIAYSLGNFLTYRRFNLSGPNGIAPLVQVSVDPDGKYRSAVIIPLYQDSQGHVRVDPHRRVIGRLRDLIAMDFPDSDITVSDEGFVELKTAEQ